MKVGLECSYRAVGVGERILQMLEGVCVIIDITLIGRRAHAIEMGAYVWSAAPPFFHPAVSSGDGEREGIVFPGSGDFHTVGDGEQQLEELSWS